MYKEIEGENIDTQENRQVKSPGGIQVIARAANILRVLENENDGLSLAQIASRVELPRSTVQRIVNALAEEHLLIAASSNARVSLGPAIVRMAANTNFDFAKFMRPHLEQLAKVTGETVDLSVPKGDKMVFIDQIAASHRLSAVSAIGSSFPAFSSANGKAALSLMEDVAIANLLENAMFKETPNTISSLPKLLKEIGDIRSSSLAVDDQEHSEGISAVGTAFLDPLGRIYAVSVPVPTIRFVKSKQSISEALLSFRQQLLAELNE